MGLLSAQPLRGPVSRRATLGSAVGTILFVLTVLGGTPIGTVRAATSPPAPPTTAATATATTSPPPTTTTTAATTAPRADPTSAEPTRTPTPTTTATSQTTTPPTATPKPQRPGTPPAVAQAGISLTTVLLAVVALAVASLVLYLVHRGAGRPEAGQTLAPPGGPVPETDGTEALTELLVELGEAMIDAGYPVTDVQDTLHRVAEANGIPDSEVIVLPTALFVSSRGRGALETAGATAGHSALRLDQIDEVSRVAAAAGAGTLRPAAALRQVHEIRERPPPFGALAQTLGYAVFSAGLALILRGGMADVLVAAVLGLLVGALQLAAAFLPTGWRAVLPFTSAFCVSVAVFLLSRSSLDVGILPPLIAPLVTFLPGALLTISVIELSTGQLVSGAGRLAGGAMQLLLLALGIVAGAQLVGVPATAVGDLAAQPFGDLAPWIGVALFGAGVVVNRCARPAAVGWILLVLYVAYGAQVIGGLFLGGPLSAFVGALAMAPVGAYVASRPTGPSTQVSFLPAFWLLVPGSLGLVGVTMLLGDDWDGAVSALVTTGTTMVGISFGVLIGQALPFARARGRVAGR